MDYDKLRDLQLKMTENMKQIHQFCSDNNIKYSLGHGSAIGAIRHKGFIPWDDDIDIIMDRYNYNKFCNLAQNGLPENLGLINFDNNDNIRNLMSKVVDRELEITYVSSNNEKLTMGLFIDIFVFDKIPLNGLRYKFLYITRLYVLLLINRMPHMNKGKILKILSILILKTHNLKMRKKIAKRFISYLNKLEIDLKQYAYAEVLIFNGKFYKYNSSLFDAYQMIKFEDTEFMIVSEYDDMLRIRYEGDYYILPPADKRVPHHNIIETRIIKK